MKSNGINHRMKTVYGVMIVILLVCIILAGCSKSSESNNGGSPETSLATDNSQEANTSYEDEVATMSQTDLPEAIIADESQVPVAADNVAEIKSTTLLGPLTAKPMTIAGTTLHYRPEEELSGTVTDGYGKTWRLTIPAGALEDSVDITFTGLEQIAFVEGNGIFGGGVVIQPENLKFNLPITLTCEGAEAEGVVVTSNDAGENVRYVLDHPDKIQLNHFSQYMILTAYDADDSTMDLIEDEVLKIEKEVYKQANEFLIKNKKQITVPTPPAYPFTCENDEGNKAKEDKCEAFIKEAFNPEWIYIQQILDVESDKSLLGIDGRMGRSLTDNQTLQLLLARLDKKTLQLQKTYKKQPEFMTPILRFSLQVGKNISLLGNTEWFQNENKLLDIGNWTSDMIDPLVERLKTEHDYALCSHIWRVAKEASSVGVLNLFESTRDKIQKAMRFDVVVSLSYVTEDGAYMLFSRVPVKYSDDEKGYQGMITGQATPEFMFQSQDADIAITAKPLPLTVKLYDFNPCEGTAKLWMSGIYSNSEVMTIEDESMALSVTKPWWEFCFSEYKETLEGGWSFPLTIKNMNPVLCETSVEAKNNSGGKMTIDLSIKIEHTPK